MLSRSSRLWLRSPTLLPPRTHPDTPLNRLARTNLALLGNPHSVSLARKYHSTRPIFSMTAANGTNAYGNFDLVTRARLDYADILVSKWRSRVTGLSIVHLDYNGAPRMTLSLSGSLVM